MKEIIRKISVDLARKGNARLIFARQNDKDSRKIVIHLTDGGIPYFVSEDMSAIVNFARPDGESGAFSANVESDGSVSLTLGVWPLAVQGEVVCSVSLFDGEERKLTSADFYLDVETALYSGEGITEDESYSLLTSLMSDMSKINDAEEQRKNAEAERFAAEEKRNKALEDLEDATERANAISSELEAKLASGAYVGKDGKDGKDGADGYTPVRGADYWTAEDIAEIKAYIDQKIAESGAGSGGNEEEEVLTPSVGLEFLPDTISGEYGVAGMGSCTDTVVVVPSTTPEGYAVKTLGVLDSSSNWRSFGNGTTTRLILPDSVVAIQYWAISYEPNLVYIKFGKYFESIDAEQHISGVTPESWVLDFSDYARDVVPTAADTSLIVGASEIRVPAAMVDAWKVATNWSAVADKIVGV